MTAPVEPVVTCCVPGRLHISWDSGDGFSDGWTMACDSYGGSYFAIHYCPWCGAKLPTKTEQAQEGES